MFPSESAFSGTHARPMILTHEEVESAARQARESLAAEHIAASDLEMRRLRERIGDVRDRLDHHDLKDRQATERLLADVVAELSDIQVSL